MEAQPRAIIATLKDTPLVAGTCIEKAAPEALINMSAPLSQFETGLGMKRPHWSRRVASSVGARTLRKRDALILRCRSGAVLAQADPIDCRLTRVRLRDAPRALELVQRAMVNAQEPSAEGLIRLEHGDEFFGWSSSGVIRSFGWVTHRDRIVGGTTLRNARGRVFLYNFHTLLEYRGHGLYPRLLLAIKSVLAAEGHADFVIDVDAANTSSLRGIEKADFVAVAQVSFVTILNRLHVSTNRLLLADGNSDLFVA